MLRHFRRFAAVLLLLSAIQDIHSQVNCVNYDSRYPITSTSGKKYLWNPVWNFPTLKQKKVSNLNIGNTGMWRGLLEYLPASYKLAANSAKKYPVIIYFHGGGSKGLGSALELCRLFKDRGGDSVTYKAVPGQVERNTGLFTQSYGGVNYEYIVISPQFTQYTRLQPGVPDKFPSAKEVEAVINYVVATYRIDSRRIYLTGFSNGANMIIEYAGSSVARAKRVAAIMPVSLCSQLGHISNKSMGVFAKNIGLAKLKTWFVFCEADNCGSGPALNVPNAWVDSIRKVPGNYPPRYTRLRNINPATLYNCSDTLLHDAWSRAYDPNFKASFNYTTSASQVNDGINLNMYQWFARQISPAATTVAASSFNTRLSEDKVELTWNTTEEIENSSFSIERAGPDQQYLPITTLPGALNSETEKKYAFTDMHPLDDLSFYRLVQTDMDGSRNYIDIRKVVNQKLNKGGVIISPNPFNAEVSAFVSLDKSQKVNIMLADMTGKIIQSVNGIYSRGSSEVKLNVQDLPSGVYLLKVSGENFSNVKKIVKK
ncbi:MAG: T9SS type A sorting domain-containing protein [Flavitalea sp.]